MSEEQSFSSFRKDRNGKAWHLTKSAASVQDFMEQVNQFYANATSVFEGALVAWGPADWLFKMDADEACAKAIAAGRLIDRIDGKFVAHGYPITSQPRSPYFAEAVEENHPYALKASPAPIPEDMVAPDDGWIDDWIADALNAPMLARDAANYVAKPAAAVIPTPAVSTAHPAIAGLVVLAGGDHRFGGHAFHSA